MLRSSACSSAWPRRPGARRPDRRDLRGAGRLDRPPHHRDHAPADARARPFGRPRGQGLGKPVRVGPIVSRRLLQLGRGAVPALVDRGVLAVEMEAAVLFTLGALRKVAAGLPSLSVVVVEQFVRITDDGDEGRRRPDDRAGAGRRADDHWRAGVVFVVVQRRRTGRHGGAGQDRPPGRGARARGETLMSERRGHAGELARRAAEEAPPRGRSRGRRNRERGLQRPPSASRTSAQAGGDRPEQGRTSSATPGSRRARGRRGPLSGAARTIDAGRISLSRLERRGRGRLLRQQRERRDERRGRTTRELRLEGARQQASFLYATLAVFARWHATEMEVEVDDERRSGLLYDAIVANCRYLGGGMAMTDAEPDDGLSTSSLSGHHAATSR